MNRTNVAVVLALGAAMTASAKLGPAGVHGEPPDDTRAWAECDRNRPNPPKITVPEDGVPSDARVIVGPDREKTLANFTHPDGSPIRWDYKDGVLQINRKGPCGHITGEYADFQLHMEWKTPKGFEKRWAGGNSGVIIHPGRRYEIQILDSSRTGIDSPDKMDDYSDGQAGAVYGQTCPLVNPARAPGEWQSYDIIFHAAKWEKGVLVHPATVSVIYNGVLVQDNWEMRERVDPPKNDKRAGKIAFQNHGYDVAFRNVWIRELQPRWANTTHGGPYVVKSEVMALRKKTAATLFSEMAPTGKPSAQRVEQAAEIICYDKSGKYMALFEKEEKAFLKFLEKADKKTLDADRDRILRLRKVYDMLVNSKVLEPERPLHKKLIKLIEDNQYKNPYIYWWG